MNTSNVKFQIETMVYDNMSNLVLVTGMAKQAQLSFKSAIEVSFTALNRILNQLQSQRADSTENLFVAEELGEYTQYFADLRKLPQTWIDLSSVLAGENQKLICA